jgi:beta-mannanase
MRQFPFFLLLCGAAAMCSSQNAPRVLAQTGGKISVPEALPKMPKPSNGASPRGASAGSGQRAKFEPAGDGVYHGASLPETWDDNKLRRQISDYQKVAGKKLSVVTWFASAYENGRMTSWKNNYLMPLRRVKNAGAVSLIKFSVQDYAYDRTKRIASTREIAAGVYDAYFEEAAAAVKEFNAPVFISLNHEMNGTWYPYSEGAGQGATAADFVASWRHIVDIFRQGGADNAAFVWSPNVPDIGPVPFTKYYPGDDYVDWVGVSFYSGNPMSNLQTIYKTYAARKPIFVTEWATSTQKNAFYKGFPGEAQWINDFFAAIESNYPRVRAISWFQWDKEDGNHLLQRVPEQAQAYNADIQKTRYLQSGDAILGSGSGNSSEYSPPVESAPQEIILRESAPLENVKKENVKTENPRPSRPRLRLAPHSN